MHWVAVHRSPPEPSRQTIPAIHRPSPLCRGAVIAPSWLLPRLPAPTHGTQIGEGTTMKMKSLLLAASFLAALGTGAAYAEDVVTVYSADGLHDGSPNWYQTEFDAFTKATGIKVQYVEGGSGVVVERIA